MNISCVDDCSFRQFFLWRVAPKTKIKAAEAEELMSIRDSINADFWMKNYDVDAFVYTAPKTKEHPCMRAVKLFIRPARNYFARIKKHRPGAKIEEYERASIPIALKDEALEDKIREFLRKQQSYIKHCVHSDDHGIIYKHNRDNMFSFSKTKPLEIN